MNTTESYTKKTASSWEENSFIWKLYPSLVEALLKPHFAVCDLGCGTGSLLLSLKEQYAKGLGLDLSEHMLNIARIKAEGSHHLQFEQGDINSFLMPGEFDLILCTDGVIPYLPDERSVRDFISRVYLSLVPGGKTLFEFWTDKANTVPAKSAREHPGDLTLDRNLFEKDFLLEETPLPGGKEKRFRYYYPGKNFSHTVMCFEEEQVLHRFFYLSEKQIREFCHEAGFIILRELGLQMEQEEIVLGEFTQEGTLMTLVLQKPYDGGSL